MTSGRRILLAYASSLLNVFPTLVINLWLLRKVVSDSSDADVGLYFQVGTLGLYLSTLQMGLDFAASQSIAASLGRNDPEGAARAAFQLRRFNRVSGFAVFVLVVGAVIWSASATVSTPVSPSILIGLVTWVGLTQVVCFLSRSASAVLIGAESTYMVNVITTGRMLATLPIGYGLYSAGWGVVSLVAADGIAQTIAAVVLDTVRKNRCPWSTRPVADPMSGFRKLLLFATGSTIGSVAWTIEAGADVFLLDWIPGGGGKQAVATYGIWWKFPQMAFTVCSGLAASAFPSFSKLYAVHPAHAAELLRRVAIPACGLVLLVTAGIGMWLTPFLHHWMGGRFDIENGPRLAVLIGLLVALRAYGNLLGLFWLATGRSTLTTTLCWAQATVKVLLAFWWIPIAGLHGLFAASCVSVGIQIFGVGFALYRTRLLSARDAMIALAGLAIVAIVSDAVAVRTADFNRLQLLDGVALTVTISGGVALGLRRRMRRVLTS